MSITHILATELIDGATGIEGEDRPNLNQNQTVPQRDDHFMSPGNLALEQTHDERK